MDIRFITILVLVFLFSTLNFCEPLSAGCLKPRNITVENMLSYLRYPTKCCQENLKVFEDNSNGKYPEKPKIFEVTDFLRESKEGIKVVWNANTANLKGFKIVFENITETANKNESKNMCRVLDYSEFLMKNTNVTNRDFQFELHPVRKNNEFLVHLYPLPESGNNYPPPQKVDTIICREWTTPISYRKKDNKLIGDFEQGPSKCNIKAYDVTLIDENSKMLKKERIYSSKTTSELTYEFLGICSGTYEVVVEIYDQYWNIDQKCICASMNEKCGERCYRSKTGKFILPRSSCVNASTTYVSTTKYVPSTTKPGNVSKLTIFLAVIGAMIGLLLLGLVFYCLKRSIQEKRGVLFYTEDHSYHCDAIAQFLSFMNKSKCKIEAAANLVKGGDPLRLSLEIQKSDFVILVYSKALHKRIQAWRSNQDYINFFKEDNSALLTVSLLRELTANNKLIICTFPQMSKTIVSSEFPSVKCYTLTKELNLLIQQIHGTGVEQDLAILIKSNKLNHKFNTLTNAIKNAANFEEKSSNWFESKYICPKKMDSLNEIVDCPETFPEGYEPSIYSNAISCMLEQINEQNDRIA